MWQEFYKAFRGQLSGREAIRQAAEQNRIDHYFTFTNFEKSAARCAHQLEEIGLSQVELEDYPADGVTTWSGWRAMKAWDVETARLVMTEPERTVLADWRTNPTTLAMYSGPFEIEGECVEWNGEPDIDLTGKIPLTRLRIMDVFDRMRAMGAKGILSDFIGTLPGVRDAFDLPDEVRWENFAYKNHPGDFWGFMLTPRQGSMLRAKLREGRVTLRAEIRTRLYDGIMRSVTGVIPGTSHEDREILLTSHLYEPGGNDNASGVGLGIEIARALNDAIEEGVIPRPHRSIRFLFSWEGFGLFAWVHRHRDRISRIIGGVNIDELGVDQEEGRSTLHLFMPPAANDSCIGYLLEHLCHELLTPSVRWKSVSDRPEIINDSIVLDPNIDIVTPTLIQYPSRHYHASSDTIETLSSSTMEAMGNLCATHLYFLARAEGQEVAYLARLTAGAFARKMAEIELRLLDSTWPFSRARTAEFFGEKIAKVVSSFEPFGLDEPGRAAIRRELEGLLESTLTRCKSQFPLDKPRPASQADLDHARQRILERTTLGIPMAPEIRLDAEPSRKFFDVLYKNNLDLLFFRLCYWANGRRTLLEIIDLLEVELDQLLQDASIARTGTGALINAERPLQLDVAAVNEVARVIVECGYLQASDR